MRGGRPRVVPLESVLKPLQVAWSGEEKSQRQIPFNRSAAFGMPVARSKNWKRREISGAVPQWIEKVCNSNQQKAKLFHSRRPTSLYERNSRKCPRSLNQGRIPVILNPCLDYRKLTAARYDIQFPVEVVTELSHAKWFQVTSRFCRRSDARKYAPWSGWGPCARVPRGPSIQIDRRIKHGPECTTLGAGVRCTPRKIARRVRAK